MSAKQILPLLVKIAPPLALFGGVCLLLKWLLSDEKKSEPVPANAAGQGVAKPVPTPAPIKPPPAAATPAVPHPPAAPPSPKVSAAVPTPPTATSIPPQIQPLKGGTITRNELAIVFNHGSLAMSRKAAVAALTNLGFSKTAAYQALSPDGRFVSWLDCAPDGTITWTG